jgi:hypothetical protein
VKYAVVGFLGGVLVLIIDAAIGHQSEASWATLVGLTIDGYIGERRGRTR